MRPHITLNSIQSLAEVKVMERGMALYHDEAILNPVKRENRLEAFCHGSQIYRVSAIVADDNIGLTNCTCPYDWGGICKHRVALLLTYLHEADKFVQRPTITQLLAKKDKDDLIDLIENMLSRHLTLIELVDPDLDLPDELFFYDEY